MDKEQIFGCFGLPSCTSFVTGTVEFLVGQIKPYLLTSENTSTETEPLEDVKVEDPALFVFTQYAEKPDNVTPHPLSVTQNIRKAEDEKPYQKNSDQEEAAEYRRQSLMRKASLQKEELAKRWHQSGLRFYGTPKNM